MISRSSAIKRPKPALSLYYAARRETLLKERPEMTKQELRTHMNEEWKSMKHEQKETYLRTAEADRALNGMLVEQAQALGVDEFLKEARESRLKDDAEADLALAILDNKRSWKKTWGRRVKGGSKRLKLN